MFIASYTNRHAHTRETHTMATPQDLRQLASTLASLAEKLATESEPAPAEPARQVPPRVMFTAEEAAEQLGIGRTVMFRLLRSGDIESVRIGRLRRVPATAIHDYAARLVAGTGNHATDNHAA